MTRLERLVAIVLRSGVIGSSACLSVGLALTLLDAGGAVASFLLNAGVVVLICTPVARVFTSMIEYIIERDWQFTTFTAIVLVELIASAVAALVFNRRL